MEVVEVRSKTESLYGAFDVLLDVRRRVCDFPVSPIEAIEPAFRGNCISP